MLNDDEIYCSCGCGSIKNKFRSQGRLATTFLLGHRKGLNRKPEAIRYPDGVKLCAKCGSTKPLEAFGKRHVDNRVGVAYIRARCLVCVTEDAQEYKNRIGPDAWREIENRSKANCWAKNPVRYWIQDRIAVYRKQTAGSDLTVDFLEDLFHHQEAKCYFTAAPIEMGAGHKHGSAKYHSASLDKLDPTKGYMRGNVAWVGYQTNTSKGARTEQEFYSFCELILRIRQTRQGIKVPDDLAKLPSKV